MGRQDHFYCLTRGDRLKQIRQLAQLRMKTATNKKVTTRSGAGRKHPKGLPFLCPYCPVAHATKDLLAVHLTIHGGGEENIKFRIEQSAARQRRVERRGNLIKQTSDSRSQNQSAVSTVTSENSFPPLPSLTQTQTLSHQFENVMSSQCSFLYTFNLVPTVNKFKEDTSLSPFLPPRCNSPPRKQKIRASTPKRKVEK